MELHELTIYVSAKNLATEVYSVVSTWSQFDRMTLGTQIVRAADSVPSNIAEGYGRYSRQDARRFLLYARGSLTELQAQLELARERGLVNEERFDQLDRAIKPLMVGIKSFGRKLSDTRS